MSRDSEAVPETRGAPVDRQRQILIRHYSRTEHKKYINLKADAGRRAYLNRLQSEGPNRFYLFI